MITQWTCKRPDSAPSEEMAVQITATQAQNAPNILILPALFDEANKMRRHTVEVMRRLAEAGISSVLPDLPGMNESLAPICQQSLTAWRYDAAHACDHFKASHTLTIRGGALIAPDNVPGWRYAAANGERLLRNLIRARIVTSREAGIEESTADLHALGKAEGIELAGWQFGPQMFGELINAKPHQNPRQTDIAQSDLGGAGLWLRAEPSEDAVQADALTDHIVQALAVS